MIIVFPKATGMCFGVKDALTAIDQIEQPSQTAIWGELVHNPTITTQLQQKGFHQIEEAARQGPEGWPSQSTIVVTAHGVSDATMQMLRQHGKDVIDTTCPLVRRAHKAVLFQAKRGYHVLVVGKRNHVEVQGLVGDIPAEVGYTVIETTSEVMGLQFSGDKVALVAQTTTPPELFQEIAARVRRDFPHLELRIVDTICQPTRDRQESLAALLPKVDALVVVGGKGSNNTRRLCEQGSRANKPWVWVERAEELSSEFFLGKHRVALAAGTSTPDEVVQQVHRRLLDISRTLAKSLKNLESRRPKTLRAQVAKGVAS